MWVRLLALIAVVNAAVYDKVFVEYGSNLGTTIPSRISALLQQAGCQVFQYTSSAQTDGNSLVLSFGNASLAQSMVDISNVALEGFKVVTDINEAGTTLVAANGQPLDSMGKSFAMGINNVHYGAALGAYSALESLGFAFVHPLNPYIPSELVKQVPGSRAESPYWPVRTWHVHTEHPLEFTEVLNGFDVPMLGSCRAGSYCQSWESMFADLGGLFEWSLANRQNRVEVLLLGNDKWELRNASIAKGDIRQSRLRQISQLAHQYGILMGADIPLAMIQQHGWAMISVRDSYDKQVADIRARVDWAFGAEYDFLSTEAGLSEFTKPSCDLMLDLFNTFTNYVTKDWNREAYTKVHCSTNEFCTEVTETGAPKYPDPRTGKPINFNLLPTYADGGLGVMPHTVQVYSFDDPSGGAYGNTNFSYMLDYIMYEASIGKRDVLYYGESAYWVNVDVDVPLILPLSGQRRLYDLRRTAKEELKTGHRMQGQMNFESGWEFGYWISNLVTARAVYQPYMDVVDEWDAFRLALSPIAAIFGQYGKEVTEMLVSFSQLQANLMVLGLIDGQPNPDLSKLSGHAYLSGADPWVDLPRMLGISLTQPDKIHIHETSDPNWATMMKLLKEMSQSFSQASSDWKSLLQRCSTLNKNALLLLTEIEESVELLSLRASQVYALYQSADPATSLIDKHAFLNTGRDILSQAQTIMDRRVAAFRVPADRISDWREGPTTYPMGYVWSARTLYYWWRDQGQTEGRSVMSALSPCYLNRQEPIELVLGWGKAAEEVLRLALIKRGMDSNRTMITSLLADCLAPPLKQIEFPRDL